MVLLVLLLLLGHAVPATDHPIPHVLVVHKRALRRLLLIRHPVVRRGRPTAGLLLLLGCEGLHFNHLAKAKGQEAESAEIQK